MAALFSVIDISFVRTMPVILGTERDIILYVTNANTSQNTFSQIK
jgi:hypothetical protein